MKGDSSKRPIPIEDEQPRKEEDNDNARSHEDLHEEAHIAHEKHLEAMEDQHIVPNKELFGHYTRIFMQYWWNETTLLSN